MKLVRMLAVTLVTASLSACMTVGPDYQKPAPVLPNAFSDAGTEGTVPDAWWTLFGDPALDQLITAALAANQDLAQAAARVEEARALVGLTNADRFPQVTGQAGASRTKFSGDNAQLPPGFSLEQDDFRIAAAVSYELDFWGRLRRATEAARAELLATEEARRNVQLALTADLATAYFDLVAFDQQLAVVRETISTRSESVRLQGLRFDAGTISELDLAQAQAERAAAEATLPVLERQRRQTENRIQVLLGRTGGPISRTATLDEVALPATPVGLPSQLLERRPDIVAAEQLLIAANARIGVARAAYFPSISLTGYAGTQSSELSNLFASGTGIWQAALGLVQPIFNAGKTRRNVEAAEARERQALAAYTKAVQSAFAEVEDALVARSTGVAEREALARQVEALARARRLGDLRYEGGDSSYLEVLDADRNLFSAELALTRVRRDELAAAVTLFKALGGGWEAPTAATP